MRRLLVLCGLLAGFVSVLVVAPPVWAQDAAASGDYQVQTAILRGTPLARPAPSRPDRALPAGDISLNFPGVDVQAVAKAVLGDTLNAPYTIDPGLHTPVTVTTPHPIRRADVAGVFERALSNANLALVARGGAYVILPATAARAQAPSLGPTEDGYGNETLPLKFVNAEEMRKLLEPLVPGGVSATDQAQNVLVISGNSTQRKALRDLVAQFDVDWLRGMSFALMVPQRTDARLIAPELEKLLNGPGAPIGPGHAPVPEPRLDSSSTTLFCG